jgi:hypothetical protein
MFLQLATLANGPVLVCPTLVQYYLVWLRCQDNTLWRPCRLWRHGLNIFLVGLQHGLRKLLA